MPGYLFHVGGNAMCAHSAQVNHSSTNTRVKVSSQQVAIQQVPIKPGEYTVTGCGFQVPTPAGSKPQPCVSVTWTNLASRVKVMGQPVVLQDSTGQCWSGEQILQGAPTITTTQTRVKGI
ncbi:hypothetical protein NTE_00488 [Candidatus Nitrososphaera evergladensis SR1]|uniref:Uncharacterized protein n=1 Tax=Candidatus Nitrososphaera evergladensis SR1 TaxID=1459636 RepID=A0A075MTD6_9ARCH|nr:hypothetical protein [Candidatus Nitrososphaera evergladensis]AIF82569.1 hypothetical protein NTE_00488 [Candidatus Nitrososphaera evergladensis SR1]